MVRIALLLLVLGLIPNPATAQTALTLEITAGTEEWPIEGRTEEAMIENIRANSPLRSDYRFDIQAFPYYDQRVGEGCWIAGGSMTAHTIVSQPNWADYARANRSLRRRWDRYIEAVRIHGEGHVEISRQGAEIIAQRLSAIPPQENCAQLQAVFDAMLNEFLDHLQESHRIYDTESGGMPRITTPLPIRR